VSPQPVGIARLRGEPKWTGARSHINLGKVLDPTQQRERARNEYQQAIRTKDETQAALQAHVYGHLNRV
jgi:hypothetical protein